MPDAWPGDVPAARPSPAASPGPPLFGAGGDLHTVRGGGLGSRRRVVASQRDLPIWCQRESFLNKQWETKEIITRK